MSKNKKIIYHACLFLQNLKKEGLSTVDYKEKERYLSDFVNYLNNQKIETIDQITIKKIEDYKIYLASKKNRQNKYIKEETQKRYLKTVKLFLDFLTKKDLISVNWEKCLTKEREETEVQKLITYYFETKGIPTEKLKNDAKKRKIIYSRYTKPAKDLIELSESLEKAMEAIDIVSKWAKSRELDYAIETVFKKWPELQTLKPKKIEKKPFYRNDRMIKSREKWYVIDKDGNWLEFAGKEEEIDWL